MTASRIRRDFIPAYRTLDFMVDDLTNNRSDILNNDYCVYTYGAATGLFYYISTVGPPAEGWDNEKSRVMPQLH